MSWNCTFLQEIIRSIETTASELLKKLWGVWIIVKICVTEFLRYSSTQKGMNVRRLLKNQIVCFLICYACDFVTKVRQNSLFRWSRLSSARRLFRQQTWRTVIAQWVTKDENSLRLYQFLIHTKKSMFQYDCHKESSAAAGFALKQCTAAGTVALP